MTTRQWRRKLFALFFAGSLWRRYLVIYSFIALAGATWLFGPALLAWWFHRPGSLVWKLITSILLIAGFAVSVALYNLLWVNRPTQARSFNGALSAIVLRGRSRLFT
jgi:hypothetical protein